MQVGKMEQRTFDISGMDVRDASNDSEAPKITGYGAVFNTPADIGGMFTEIIAPGAFAKALSSQSDVRALFNHNWDYVLGRTRSGTLTLEEDAKGLRFTVTPPATQWADDLRSSMLRGDITQCSFGFNVTKEDWNYDTVPATRTIQEVQLYEISVVSLPAYEETEAAVVRTKDIYTRAKEDHELRMKTQKLMTKIQEALK
ncbi:HK97 family phage prohead protease [Bacillus sp. SPB7]|nr:HK97 family phage prohead protease [Bacillus rugosus]MEC5258489.1 HK97 family phage prohead protease [Bacillus amyloliquefaciens]NUF07050.1 HK97 family phage prohead protease [Bacillus rugosus]